MNRLPVAQTKLDNVNTRTRVTVHSDPCTPGTQLARMFQYELLRMMGEDPSLTQCGMADFQTLQMTHDGTKWVVIIEAIHPSA